VSKKAAPDLRHVHRGKIIHAHPGGLEPHTHRTVTLADPENDVEAANPEGSYEEFLKLFGTGGVAGGAFYCTAETLAEHQEECSPYG
jgi:hypothetical protein